MNYSTISLLITPGVLSVVLGIYQKNSCAQMIDGGISMQDDIKIAFVTNHRAPYRGYQLKEFSKIPRVKMTAYYTNKVTESRNWELIKNEGFDEVNLKGYKIGGKYGYLNMGVVDIVNNNDIILIGGYEQPTYIFLSILCRLLKKPYVICFDGISTNRLTQRERFIKKFLKNIVVSKAKYILGNGIVSKRYFTEVFNYPAERIYNQYLTVDGEKINSLYEVRDKYRYGYRKKYNIDMNEKVLIYSGRLIDIKNVASVIKAISKIKRVDLTLLITGGGILDDELKKLATKLGVKIIITGFISEQEELFKHYFAADALILPSTDEPWGLVVNEAMFAGLPVLVSSICGCSMDLVKDGHNGYIINPYDIDDISIKIYNVLYELNMVNLQANSLEIIERWSFKSSNESFKKILTNIVGDV